MMSSLIKTKQQFVYVPKVKGASNKLASSF